MRHDRIGPEHSPRPVLPARRGLWASVLSRLRPALTNPAPAPGAAAPPRRDREFSDPAALSAPALSTPGGEAAFHPRRTPLFRPFLADPRPMIFGAADPVADAPAVRFLQDAGLDVVTCPSLRSALSRAHGQPMAWSGLILMIDGFGGPRLVADGLMALRRKLPHLPVILVSEEVRFHDFSPERLALCDVTLRAPLSAPALELALAEAPANNLVWQTRVAAMRAPAL